VATLDEALPRELVERRTADPAGPRRGPLPERQSPQSLPECAKGRRGFMAITFLQKLGDIFKDRRVDVAERFQLLREAISGTMSNFHMALDRTTGKTVGLKILDPEASSTS
jgi:hypothetical protein